VSDMTVGIPVTEEFAPSDLVDQISLYFERGTVEAKTLVDNR